LHFFLFLSCLLSFFPFYALPARIIYCEFFVPPTLPPFFIASVFSRAFFFGLQASMHSVFELPSLLVSPISFFSQGCFPYCTPLPSTMMREPWRPPAAMSPTSSYLVPFTPNFFSHFPSFLQFGFHNSPPLRKVFRPFFSRFSRGLICKTYLVLFSGLLSSPPR